MALEETTHDFRPIGEGGYVDQHGCRLVEDRFQVRLYWRTRYDAHAYPDSLAQFLADEAPPTRELGGSLTPADVQGG